MRYVVCRRQCIRPDFAGTHLLFLLLNDCQGTRVAKVCAISERYFEIIDECVPIQLASSPDFVYAFFLTKTCPGGTIRTPLELEAYRYCNVISSGLTIELNDASVTFDALFDIDVVQGWTCAASCVCGC